MTGVAREDLGSRLRTSVVIATYSAERLEDLASAIDSLDQQTVAPAEVIVAVDRNAKLVEVATQAFPGVQVVPNSLHAGAGGTRNSGAAAASGDVLAFLDDDAIATPTWIESIESALDDDQVIGVGGLIEPRWLADKPAWFPEEFGWVVGCSYRGLPEGRAKVRNLIAANMAMRRDLFAQLGGFRPAYGKQGSRSEPEETDLCIRAGHLWPDRYWLYDPAVHVLHGVPANRLRFGYYAVRCINEGRGKASLSRLVGSGAALSEERRYAQQVLPAGVARGISRSIRTGRPDGLIQAAAIIVGLMLTALGLLTDHAAALLDNLAPPILARKEPKP